MTTYVPDWAWALTTLGMLGWFAWMVVSLAWALFQEYVLTTPSERRARSEWLKSEQERAMREGQKRRQREAEIHKQIDEFMRARN